MVSAEGQRQRSAKRRPTGAERRRRAQERAQLQHEQQQQQQRLGSGENHAPAQGQGQADPEAAAARAAKRKAKKQRKRNARLNEESGGDQGGAVNPANPPQQVPNQANQNRPDARPSSGGPNANRPQNNQPRERNNRGKNGRRRERTPFDPWMEPEAVKLALANSQLSKVYQGTIRINKRRRHHAYVSVDGFAKDFFVLGLRDRNRALQGDTVAIKMLGEATMKELDAFRHGTDFFKRTQQQVTEVTASVAVTENEDVDIVQVTQTTQDIAVVDGTPHYPAAELSNDDAEALTLKNEPEQPPAMTLYEEVEQDADEDDLPRPVGLVVSIIERRPGSIFSGFLMPSKWQPGMDKDKSDRILCMNGENPPKGLIRTDAKSVFFRPTDNAAPLMLIARRQCPEDLDTNYVKYRDQMYTVRFDKWVESCNYPFASLSKALGDMGNIVVETEAILESNCVRRDPFSDKIIQSLPTHTWVIPKEEIARRRDLREERIFTIDPETARDLDDAVSVKVLPNGNLSVGVHIADVSHFVLPNTALDHEAQQRATTTYMVQQAYPMLPNVLCEHLCSLNPGVERLAFSVMWTMTPNAEIIDSWFGRVVIRSCIKLSYGMAQSLIDGQPWSEVISEAQGANVGKHQPSEIIEDLRALHRLSRILRKARFDGGALSINQPRLSFRLNDEGLPIDCAPYEIKESNQLIEEFMLLANVSVAQKISTHFEQSSLLRCHPPPNSKALDEFTQYLDRMGFPEIDTTSSGAIQRSIGAIEDPFMRQILSLLAVRPMQRALYFCTDDRERPSWRHYALNFEVYTHFTSPIRRYADIVVHRLLQAAIDEDQSQASSSGRQRGKKKQHPLVANPSRVTAIAKQCNVKKEDARAAQDASLKLFLCIFLRDMERASGVPIIEEAIVMDIGEKAFDVYLPRYALDRRAFCQDSGCARVETNEKRTVMTLFWSQEEEMADKYTLPPYGDGKPTDDELENGTNSQGGKFVVWKSAACGEPFTVRILQKLKVRVCVIGRSPLDIKVFVLHPTHYPMESAAIERLESLQDVCVAEEAFAAEFD